MVVKAFSACFGQPKSSCGGDLFERSALEPPFAPHDDLVRFAGLTSRSQCIDQVRQRIPSQPQ